jgi:aerobic-type carbon monoxide dehydrogenase small subunit (CoxS/CutS family)
VVHVDGQGGEKLHVLAQDVAGSAVTTIEGMANADGAGRCSRRFRTITGCSAASARRAW